MNGLLRMRVMPFAEAARRVAVPVLVMGLTALGAPARAEEVRMYASNAVKEVLLELQPAFEKESGHQLRVKWGGTPDIVRSVEQREEFDLVVIPAQAVDGLEKRGLLRQGARRDFVGSSIGAAVGPSAARVDVSSAHAFKQATLAARSVVLSSGPSSVHLLELFEKMGILDQVKLKLKRLPPGASVGEALAAGEGELGFTQVSELQHIKGIQFLGPIGSDIQRVTVFSFGWASADPNARSAASELVRYLTGPGVAHAVRDAGLEPK